MAERIPQSASYLVVFRAFLSSDGKTLATGKTIAITISKNGGAFGNPNAGATNATELSSGFYKFTLDATDTGTLGPLAWRGAEGTINDAGDKLTVANAHNAGFDGVPNAAAEAAGGLYTRGTGAGQINQAVNGKIDTNTVLWLGNTPPTPNTNGVPKVDTVLWLGNTPPTPNTNGVPKVDIVQIDGQATNGNNATLNLKQLNCVNSAGDAIVATSSFAGGSGAKLTGGSGGTALWLECAGGGSTAFFARATGGYGFQIQGGLAAMLLEGSADGAPALLLKADGLNAAALKVQTANGHGFDFASVAAGFYAINGDLVGKVLGATSSTIVGVGVRAVDGSGNALATHADIDALNQSASRRVVLVTVGQYERPESSSITYTVELRTYDGDGAAVNADSTPTLTATGIVSGSLNANLSAATNPATGVYRWTYTVASGAALEQIRFDASATIASSPFTMSAYTQVADFVAATFSTTDQSHLTAIFNKLPVNNIADETIVLAAIGTPMQAGNVTLAATQPNYAPAKAGDAMALTAGERTTLANALLDLADGVETGETLRQWARLVRAACLGKSDGFPGGPFHFRDKADAKNRITGSSDANGNRLTIATDPS